MNEELLDQILNCLELHGQAVTYEALAGVVEGIPIAVIRDLPKTIRNSWVVNSEDLMHPGYSKHEIDPRFFQDSARIDVISNDSVLREWWNNHEKVAILPPPILNALLDLPALKDKISSVNQLMELKSKKWGLTPAYIKRLGFNVLKEMLREIPVFGKIFSAIDALELQDELEKIRNLCRLLSEELNELTCKNIEEINYIKNNNPPRVSSGFGNSKSMPIFTSSPISRKRNIFLYLASKSRADSHMTQQFAMDHHFIWRPLYNSNGARISNVKYLNENDIIVLAYRDSHPIIPGGFFRVLSPFVVTKPKLNMLANQIAPFVAIHDDINLIQMLNQNRYSNDPIVKQMMGLSVDITDANLYSPEAMNVFHNAPWPSPPGNSALWPLYRPIDGWQESLYIPEPVRAWMRTLI